MVVWVGGWVCGWWWGGGRQLRSSKSTPRGSKRRETYNCDNNNTKKHRHRDPSALSTPQSLPSHDLSPLPKDYECRDALGRATKSQSIGTVNVSVRQCARNSNSGRVEAAILDLLIVLPWVAWEPRRVILAGSHPSIRLRF